MLRFEDYKKENYVLISENPKASYDFEYDCTSDMTDEDKITFVKKYYDCEDTSELIAELEDFVSAANDGTIKKIRNSSTFHPASLKKFVSERNYKCIKYGKRPYSYFETREYQCYFDWLGTRHDLSEAWRAECQIREIKDNASYLNRFRNLIRNLAEAELKHKTSEEKNSYEKENYMRIKRNKIAYSLIDSFSYRMPMEFDVREYDDNDYTICRAKEDSFDFTWSNYYPFERNKYGELVVKGTDIILDENEANEMIDLIFEYSRKISGIGMELQRETKRFVEKVKERNNEA